MEKNKQTKGRQRIDTSKRRESEEDRLITFSKRRTGLYKKASELCTLCGTELAILIFSPSGKPFSFAHPNIETIANRFFNLTPQDPNQDTTGLMDAHLRNRIDELNAQLAQLGVEGEAEKERGKKLTQMARARRSKPLCDANIDELGEDDAEKLKAWLLELQVRINNRREELAIPMAPAGAVDPNAASSSYGYEDRQF